MNFDKKLKKTIFLLYILLFVLNSVFGITPNEVLAKIRFYIEDIKDSPTGAIDSVGNYTKNSGNGLNCSGFAKWIVDGFYYPLTEGSKERYMSLKVLREKHPTERGTKEILKYEDSRDPYFGLDWTRNIAVQLGIKRGEEPYYKKYDITDSTVVDYVMNCGYPLKEIEQVIIEQEKKYPNRIYLGSINGMFGANPRLWQHYHIAVFVPYYENEELKIAVLERNKETSFSYLLKRYKGTFCHLVAIPIDGEFELMKP